MTKIIDLDALVSAPKKVKLGGKVYTLPGDLPADLYLEINQYASDGRSEAEQFAALNDRVLELFQINHPELKTLPLSLSQLMLAIPTIYSGGETEDDAPPPPRDQAGTRSSRARPKTKSQRSA